MGFKLKRAWRNVRKVYKQKVWKPVTKTTKDLVQGAYDVTAGVVTSPVDGGAKNILAKSKERGTLGNMGRSVGTLGMSTVPEAEKEHQDKLEKEFNEAAALLEVPINEAKEKAKRVATKTRDRVLAVRKGRSSTILGGGVVKDDSNLAKSKLLGR